MLRALQPSPRDSFELATIVPEGLYVVVTEHVREMRRAARDIVRAIGTGPSGLARTWNSLTCSVVRELRLRMARRFNEAGMGGPAWTERGVVILLQVARWLAIEERVDRTIAVRRTWREQMRRAWEQLTSARIGSNTPRHSEEEISRIFASLDHPEVDPGTLRRSLPGERRRAPPLSRSTSGAWLIGSTQSRRSPASPRSPVAGGMASVARRPTSTSNRPGSQEAPGRTSHRTADFPGSLPSGAISVFPGPGRSTSEAGASQPLGSKRLHGVQAHHAEHWQETR